ncbi:MAG: ABC-three component system protein [Rhodanobacter sp.]
MAKENAHSAHASAIGYLYQARLALLKGIQAIPESPDLELSIETFDDVSFETHGEPVELIQTKHHLDTSGNLTDASVDLWKTLRIWIKRVSEAVETLPRFVLMTTSSASDGSAASFLRADDRDEQKADAILLEVCESSTNEKNIAAYAAYKALLPSQRLRLLRAITILDNAPNILDVHGDICQAVRHAAPRAHIEVFVERLEGWWFGVVINALATGGKSIKVLAIDGRIDELREDFHRNALPVDHASATPTPEIVADLDKRPFVEQLRKINIGPQRIEYAMRDYYRASEQRARWVREYLLVDGELSRYERELKEAWEPRFATMVDELPLECDAKAKAIAGASVYKWVEHEAVLPFRSVSQSFLTRGSYHILANQYIVGWHPDYLVDAPAKDGEEE